jgi:hypothetical protein
MELGIERRSFLAVRVDIQNGSLPAKIPDSYLSVIKLPSRKTTVHPARRNAANDFRKPSNNFRRFSFIAKRSSISSRVASCMPGGRTFQTPLISTDFGITTQQ